MRILLIVLGLLGLAVAQEEIAQPPFPAKAIRDATSVGRRYVFDIQSVQGNIRQSIEFIAVDDESCTVRHTVETTDGQPLGEPKDSRASWSDLEGHAHFPLAMTRIEDAELDLGEHHHSCWKYTVREDGKEGDVRNRYWFAKDLPGAPVMVEVTVDGEVVFSMRLLEHFPGS